MNFFKKEKKSKTSQKKGNILKRYTIFVFPFKTKSNSNAKSRDKSNGNLTQSLISRYGKKNFK